MPERIDPRCGEPEFAIAAGAVLLIVVGLVVVWACWGRS